MHYAFNHLSGNCLLHIDGFDAVILCRFYTGQQVLFLCAKEARDVLVQREKELFYGARAIGWTLFIISVLMILGGGVIAVWDGLRSGFTFGQFFLRFFTILTFYKICDMALIDNFLLLRFHFFQYYYPEAEHVMEGRKYGFNIKSQLLKLFVIFPAVSALAAWICTLI